MDTVLTPDVQRHLMQVYVPDHRVLLSLTCRHFHHLCDHSQLDSPPSSSVSVRKLAKRGHYHLLRWILSQRDAGNWSQSTENAMLVAMYPHGVQRVGGPEELLQFVLVVWGVSSVDNLMIFAAERGHFWVVQCCRQFWGACTATEAFWHAAKSGRVEIVGMMRNEFRSFWSLLEYDNWILRGAAAGGHASLVRRSYVEWGAWDFNSASLEAATNGHAEIIRLLWQDMKVAESTVEWAAFHAARRGHLDVVRVCVDELGVTDVNAIMRYAAEEGHEQVVCWCREVKDATQIDTAMASAARGGHERLVRKCHDEWGAVGVRHAMASAASGGHMSIVRLCHDEWGVTLPSDLDRVLRVAKSKHHSAIVDQCQRWMDDAVATNTTTISRDSN